jgi:hypothetical protein
MVRVQGAGHHVIHYQEDSQDTLAWENVAYVFINLSSQLEK